MKYQFHRDSFKWNGKIFLLTEREGASYKNGTQERKKQPSLLQFFQTNTLHDSHDRFFPPGRRWHVKRTDRGAELLFSSWLVRNQSCHRPSVTPDPVIRSVARRGFSSASFNLLRSSSSRALPISFPLLSDVLINNRSLSSRAISLSLSKFPQLVVLWGEGGERNQSSCFLPRLAFQGCRWVSRRFVRFHLFIFIVRG